MATKSRPTKPSKKKHLLPPGISEHDWAITPDSVKKHISLHINSNQKDKLESRNDLPTWLVLLLNFVVVAVATVLLGDIVRLSCVNPYQVSALSVVIISLMIFHIIWRREYPRIPKNTKLNLKLWNITIPFSPLIRAVNEIHPWKLTNRPLGIFFFVFLLLGLFFNLSRYSPFRPGDQPLVIRGFSVERSSSLSPEQLASGDTLMMKSGEQAILEVVLLRDIPVSCTWFITGINSNVRTGCAIAYNASSSGEGDILSVFVQSTCGSRQESANLFVAAQP